MKQIVLINVMGVDRPGITAMVTSVFAAHAGNVLDIGQAVIHYQLTLGLLVELPEAHEESAVVVSATPAICPKLFTLPTVPLLPPSVGRLIKRPPCHAAGVHTRWVP